MRELAGEIGESLGFAKRMSYARLAYHYRVGECPGTAEIARKAERTGEWLAAWIKRDQAPSDFDVMEPIAQFLGCDWRWLFRGEGDPPEPDLYALWLARGAEDDEPEVLVPRSNTGGHGKSKSVKPLRRVKGR